MILSTSSLKQLKLRTSSTSSSQHRSQCRVRSHVTVAAAIGRDVVSGSDNPPQVNRSCVWDSDGTVLGEIRRSLQSDCEGPVVRTLSQYELRPRHSGCGGQQIPHGGVLRC